MLINLYIKNFGIIDMLDVDFQPGFNVLTGETGTGKSIIIDALQLALGGRASAEFIRTGAEKALVQATFDISGVSSIVGKLKEQGMEAPEDKVFILSREVTNTGRNVCRLNGQVVSLSFYRSIGGNLADLHIQHEQNSLLDQERHRQLLDRFGGQRLIGALAEVQSCFSRWKKAGLALESLKKDAGERIRRLDFLRWQMKEIEQADLRPGEEEELENEKTLLVNAEKIVQLVDQSYSILYEGGKSHNSIVDMLAGVNDLLKSLVELDHRLQDIQRPLESSLYEIQDAARELASYRDVVEFNPRRLEMVDERLEQVKRLNKKYGGSIPLVLEYLDSARNELEILENVEELSGKAEKELKELEAHYVTVAEALTCFRKEAARLLEESVARELHFLEMERVDFQVVFTEIERPSQNGAEQVDFLISPNPGEPLKPLVKIASGGELTRIMLAIKTLLAEVDEIPVLVFDEADTGIGGRALQAIAEKLFVLGEHHQVICVTHSAQVASYAGAHHRIFKEYDGERTITRVLWLDQEKRLEELARMLGGKEVTDITRKHAGELLRLSPKSNHL